MPEHRIRLRGGWDCRFRPGDDPEAPEVVRKVDLPIVWGDDVPSALRLTRQFGRPPFDPAAESVTLEIGGAGLVAARLNGREIVPGSVVRGLWSIPMDDAFLPRNGLVLDVELPAPGDRDGALWGDVALVIRPR